MSEDEAKHEEEVPQQQDVTAVLAEAGDDAPQSEDIPQTFPQKLMQVLEDPENADVISWLPHGKGFIIYKKKKFASDVLPKAFKQSKYTSFTRKLNRWGFTRVTRGPETGAYYHKFFQRGDVRLCMQMSCQSNKNPDVTGSKADLQNQQIIRQQLQQLQMHQFHLQQMQMQQQLQAAEMFRQQQAQQQANGTVKTEDGDDKDGKANGDKAAAAAPAMSADNAYLQTLQQQVAGGVAPMGFLPVLQPGVFPGGMPAMTMPQMPVAGVPQVAAPATTTTDGDAKPEGTSTTAEDAEAAQATEAV